MATKNKRLTISLPPDMEKQLDMVKRKQFYNKSQSDMIRHLINLGLSAKKEHRKEGVN